MHPNAYQGMPTRQAVLLDVESMNFATVYKGRDAEYYNVAAKATPQPVEPHRSHPNQQRPYLSNAVLQPALHTHHPKLSNVGIDL